MKEHVVYHAENGLWYKMQIFNGDGVQAVTAPEAFEKLYGHSQFIPAPVRAPRRESAFEVAR